MRQLKPIPGILTYEYCISYWEKIRWNGIPVCPYCDSKRATIVNKQKYRYHCNNCNTSYSSTINSIFHHTHIPLHKWFWAISIVLSDNERISARQLALALGINKNTACAMVSHIQNNVIDIRQRNLLENIANTVNQYVKESIVKGE